MYIEWECAPSEGVISNMYSSGYSVVYFVGPGKITTLQEVYMKCRALAIVDLE